MKRFVLGAMLFAVMAAVPAAQDLARLFKAAENTELVDRDCEAAIGQYQKVAAGSDRALAAQALLRMAGCHQKLGDGEARRIYERIVDQYRDQPQAAAQARDRLAASASSRPRGDRIVTSGPATTWGDGRVSPDGRFLSYVSFDGPKGLNLMLRDLVAGTERAITDVDWNGGAAGDSVFSPDGKQLAYAWTTYKRADSPAVSEVRVVTLGAPATAPARTVYTSTQQTANPIDWSPDGKTLVVRVSLPDRTKKIGLLGVDGSLAVLKTLDNWQAVGKMFFSPDGRYLAYDAPASDTDRRRDLFVIAVDGSGETPLYDPANDVVMGWSADGRLLFASNRRGSIDLWATPMSNGKPTSTTAVLVKNDIGSTESQGLTTSGALYTVNSSTTVNLQIVPVDLEAGKVTGPAVMQIHRVQTPQKPAWSPDGKLLAYAARSASGQVHVAIRDVVSNRVRELDPSLVYIPLIGWFPDGRSLLLHGRDIKGRNGTWRLDVETGRVSAIDGDSPILDGEKVYELRPDPDAGSRAGVLIERDRNTGAEREVFRKPESTGTLHPSPDRTFVAAVRSASLDSSTPGGKISTVFFFTIADGTRREVQVPAVLSAFYAVEWTPDGKALLVPGQSPAALWLVPASGGAPRKLDIDTRTWLIDSGMRLHPNGRQLAHFSGQETREVWALENIVPPRPK
jgi:Tol biopolymer transport system component